MNNEPNIRFHKPTGEERDKFDEALREYLIDNDFGGADLDDKLKNSQNAVFEVSEELNRIDRRQKKSYISKVFWDLIKDRDTQKNTSVILTGRKS